MGTTQRKFGAEFKRDAVRQALKPSTQLPRLPKTWACTKACCVAGSRNTAQGQQKRPLSGLLRTSRLRRSSGSNAS